MEPIKQEPTRDTYEHEENLIIVSKDDLIIPGLPDGVKIPHFGCITSRLTHFWSWFAQNYNFAHTPFINFAESELPKEFRELGFLGQSMVMKKLEEVSVIFHVHYYLGESTLQKAGTIFGNDLKDVKLYNDLGIPRVFLTEKDENGENQVLGFEDLPKIIGSIELAERMVSTALYIYFIAMEYARTKGVIIADAEIQLGFDPEGFFAVSNEFLTPNTSEMWYIDPVSGEKSDIFTIRRWIKENTASDGTLPPIPEDLLQKTTEEYCDLYHRLTGLVFEP